jgi:hypothetical protein
VWLHLQFEILSEEKLEFMFAGTPATLFLGCVSGYRRNIPGFFLEGKLRHPYLL